MSAPSSSLLSVVKATTWRWMIMGTVIALLLSALISWLSVRLSAQREAALQVQSVSHSYRSAILGGEVKHSEEKMRTSLSLGNADLVKVLDTYGRTLVAEPSVSGAWPLTEPVRWTGALQISALAPMYFDAEKNSLFGYVLVQRQVHLDWLLLLMIFGSLMAGQLTFVWIYRASVVRIGLQLSGELGALARALEMNSGEEETSISELHAIRNAFLRVQDEIRDLENLGIQSHDMKRVAHDIRSPLSALAIALQSLKQVPGPTRDLLNAAYGRMESIAADILKNGRDANSAQTPAAGLVQMTEDLIAEKCLEHAERGLHWGIEGSEVLNGCAEIVMAPRAGLMRSLSNLLNNAAQASSRGALVRLVISLRAGRVIFKVIDEGPGIHPQAMAAFLQGVSSKPGGHGLGLSGARRFAESHGGSLALRNLEIGMEVELSLVTTVAAKFLAEPG